MVKNYFQQKLGIVDMISLQWQFHLCLHAFDSNWTALFYQSLSSNAYINWHFFFDRKLVFVQANLVQCRAPRAKITHSKRFTSYIRLWPKVSKRSRCYVQDIIFLFRKTQSGYLLAGERDCLNYFAISEIHKIMEIRIVWMDVAFVSFDIHLGSILRTSEPPNKPTHK